MTRRPKTPRTFRQGVEAVFRRLTGRPCSFRRQPKGRRAKSGQWAKRTPCPVEFGKAVGDAMVRSLFGRQELTIRGLYEDVQTIVDDPLPVSILSDTTSGVQPPVLRIIDEVSDSKVVLEALDKVNPKVISGKVTWFGVDFASGGTDETIYRKPDGTIRVEPSRSNEP